MTTVLDWGIKVVLWLQQFSPALDGLFKALTFMGEEEFFLVLLPLLYWCLDRRNGLRVVVIFLFSVYLNGVAKVVANQPRPFEYDTRVQQLVNAPGGGLPSGHTQNTVVIWGYLAAQLRRRWLWGVAGLLMVLIPLSRLYTGVHFPTDLLGGYVLGAAVLGLAFWLVPPVERWLASQGLAWQVGLTAAVAVLLAVLFRTEDGAAITGVLLGLGTGAALERRWIRFDTSGRWWQLAARMGLGVAVLLGVRFGLKAVFAGLEPLLLFRYVRYACLGLWAALGAPWTFVKLRLAERETAPA